MNDRPKLLIMPPPGQAKIDQGSEQAVVVPDPAGLHLNVPPSIDHRTQQDRQARHRALDASHSWIVQAPAGAGKTELLTQRFLKLLTTVEEPEEILAITFTRAATAEMRGRILAALEEAATSKAEPGESLTLSLARAALAWSRARNWQLLEQPHRLDVQTIDSLCLRLAHGQPLLSRLGGQLSPTEQATALYALAARRTFALLGTASPELEAALRHLLLLRDNKLHECQQLIAGMLERREQWRHVFLLSAHASVDWDQVRAQLEAPFAHEIDRVLSQTRAILNAEPTLATELLELAQYACENGSRNEIHLLHRLATLPPAHADFLAHWCCLRNFLLTAEGRWRKSFTIHEGFPKDSEGLNQTERARYKSRMRGLVDDLQREEQAGERLRNLLCCVPSLPPTRYDETQWETLRSVFTVLRHAVAELHVVFAEQNQTDFAEISLAAAIVLDDRESTRGLLASESKRHLLIDEFQDTSRRQHQLIGRLLREWQPGDGRTCFLVGDPMQSIYIFRQAEVELFGRVQRQGLDCGSHTHPCSGLSLSENFRSHAGLVEPLNEYFRSIFGERTAGLPGRPPGEVPFAPSHASAPPIEALDAVQVHAFFCSSRDPGSGAEARVAQVEKAVALVEQELPRIHAADAQHQANASAPREYRVAILGRAKSHLAPIAAALRERGIAFRAIELESLSDRQEIIDLQSLLRALLHPLDRIAWLSVLRAPWCGLSLGDLHLLTGADQPQYRSRALPELIATRAHLLSADGSARLGRVAQVLARATSARVSSLAAWVERTWISLGAPAYLSAQELENAETFFRLLDALPPHGIDVLDGSLDASLARLCAAPDTNASEHFGVQLMTIHKAKGLGFEVVIVPGLERMPGHDDSPLITLLERTRPREPSPLGQDEEGDELLVAPLGRHGEQHRTYKWVQTQRRAREAGERKRLFYVACTRARRQLHLLGTAEVAQTGELKPGDAASLLACAWPALESKFLTALADKLRIAAVAPGTGAPAAAEPGLRPQDAEPGQIERIAAVGSSPESVAFRVPAGFAPELPLANVTATSTYQRASAPATTPSFDRPEGSFEQRARGNAVHAMLELVSQAWASASSNAVEKMIEDAARLRPQLEQLARNTLRRAGLAASRVEAIATSLVPVVLAVANHPEGRWILSPHLDARAESSFSVWTTGQSGSARLRTLRVDRSFRAGKAPLVSGSDCLWVIDYKTGTGPTGIAADAYLETQKQQWQPQLESYGAALKAHYGRTLELRYGLYFPELLRLKSWSEST